MTMINYEDDTSCPSNWIKDPQGTIRDEVTDVTNTTEFKSRLRNAGPRRGSFFTQHCENTAETNNILATISATSILPCGNPPISKSVGLETAPPRRLASRLITQRIGDGCDSKEGFYGSRSENYAPNMRKRPRRRTIYIPSDDTTIFTVHPGRQLDSTMLSGHSSKSELTIAAEISSIDASTTIKRRSRRPSLAAAPRRIPLQPTLKPLQEMDDNHKSFIAGSGKENVPPGLLEPSRSDTCAHHMSKTRRVSTLKTIPKYLPNPQESCNRRGRCEDVTGQNNKADNGFEFQKRSRMPESTISTTSASNKDLRASMMNRRNSLYYGTHSKAPSNMETCQRDKAPSKNSLSAAIVQSKTNIMAQYQFLEEDIERPELYEDAWLSHQECALQQLLNVIFDESREKRLARQWDRQYFRRQLLRLYQDPHCALIYKRLQASLLYGALNPPKGSIADTNRLKTDVGIRHKFLALWLETYELEALASAAEVIVGRKISTCSSPLNSSLPRSHKEPLKERQRNVTIFIESCLLCNKDAREQSDQSNSIWCWRRTMLRCLMMVLILEKAKEGGLWPMNLFQSSSKLKSSGEVVSGVLSLISPFLGDSTRTLSHLQYQVHHFQSPLSEFKYGIENFAIDFRDGIRLTHLVELVLYPQQTFPGFQQEDIADAMLFNDRLRSTSEQHNLWPLSQNLHLPCLTPSQKGYNVRIALHALGSVGGAVENIAEGITAEDIVNGHREKTVALLWSLVGVQDLEMLIDPKELQGEIRRLSKWGVGVKYHFAETQDKAEVTLRGMAEHTLPLQQWASASARRQGVQVSNLTTSFSDGRAFAAIVDEYQRYLPKKHMARSSGAGGLEAKLKDLGCSRAFARIFTHCEQGHVFDRNFTLAALIFLCSRLLRATKRGIAASVIFRAYQRAKYRRNIRQKTIASRLSRDRQSAYVTQYQEIAAVRVLQRYWRAYVGQRKYDRALPQRRGTLARERVVRAQEEMSHDEVDIWLL